MRSLVWALHKLALIANREFANFEVLNLQRMSEQRTASPAPQPAAGCLLWAAREGDPTALYFNGFGDS